MIYVISKQEYALSSTFNVIFTEKVPSNDVISLLDNTQYVNQSANCNDGHALIFFLKKGNFCYNSTSFVSMVSRPFMYDLIGKLTFTLLET